MATHDVTRLEKFQVDIPEERLDSLRKKLACASFPDEVDGANWDYGVPVDLVRDLVHHWATGFDWRAAERRLNELPQYVCPIQVDGFESIPLHFVYKKSSVPGAIPLLFVHGCMTQILDTLFRMPPLSDLSVAGPGLYLEVEKLLDGLTDGNHTGPSFDVVAPSLPNFGFSPAIRKRGFSAKQYAEICHKLMQALGYPQYGMSAHVARFVR